MFFYFGCLCLFQNKLLIRKERQNKQNGIVDPDEEQGHGGRGGRRGGRGSRVGGAGSAQRRTKTHDNFSKV